MYDLRAHHQIETAGQVRADQSRRMGFEGATPVEPGVVAGHGKGERVVVGTDHAGAGPLERDSRSRGPAAELQHTPPGHIFVEHEVLCQSEGRRPGDHPHGRIPVDAHRVRVDFVDHVVHAVHLGDTEIHLADTVGPNHEAETTLNFLQIERRGSFPGGRAAHT